MTPTDSDLLEDLWSGVINSISSPQNRAFLTLTKPLGLLKSEGGSNLLVAAPNGFAKDVLESRLKVALNDALSERLGERINIAVTIDESSDVPVVESEPEAEALVAKKPAQNPKSRPN